MNVALMGMALILNGTIIMISLILNGPIILSVSFNLSGTTYTKSSTNSLIEKSQRKFIESVIPSARWRYSEFFSKKMLNNYILFKNCIKKVNM